MTLTVRSRFRGPTTTGNGGYVAGRLASFVGEGPVTVTLRTPPPLDVDLDVSDDDAGVNLATQHALVATATTATSDAGDDLATVPAIAPDAAREAMRDYPGLTAHPFPECFVCGPARPVSDGMRLFPGRLGDGRTACVWDVTSELADAPEFVWAALDCPGGWSAPIEGRPMVLGRMTAQVADTPVAGEICVVMGLFVATEGRKTWTRSTVYGNDGRALGRAYATWIALPDAAR